MLGIALLAAGFGMLVLIVLYASAHMRVPAALSWQPCVCGGARLVMSLAASAG